MTETTIHPALTLDLVRDALQAAGYRVETDATAAGGPVLRSATAGLGFAVHFIPRPGGGDAFTDATLRTVFQVRGELPLELVNQWNVTRRFARLGLRDGFLALDMDIVAAGGITGPQLTARLGLWDHLVQALIVFLRAEVPRLAPDAATPPAGVAGSDAA